MGLRVIDNHDASAIDKPLADGRQPAAHGQGDGHTRTLSIAGQNDDDRRRANRPTRARSPTTSGTSTAAANTPPTPAPRRARHDQLPDRRARTRSAWKRPTTTASAPAPTVTVTVLEQAAAELLRSGPEHARPDRLLQARRTQGPTILDSKGLSTGSIIGGSFGQPGPIQHEHRGRLQRHKRLRSDPARPVRHQPGDGRVLAEVEPLRQQRRPGDGVHPELQRKRGRLPRRPQRRRVRRHLRCGDRHGRQPQQRVLPAPERRRLAPLRASCSTRTAAAGSEITPYVDGQPVSFQQESAATGQGAFANSTLYLMSRDDSSLFGNGALDELAIYNQPLSATTVFAHYHSQRCESRAWCRRSAINPAPAVTGQNVTLRRLRLDRLPGHDHRLQLGPRRQRQLRDRHRLDADFDARLHDARHLHDRPADDRQQRRRAPS